MLGPELIYLLVGLTTVAMDEDDLDNVDHMLENATENEQHLSDEESPDPE